MYNILLLHPGTQYSHQLAKQLFRKNFLFRFCTGFVLSKNSVYTRLILFFFPWFYKKIANRIISEIPSEKLTIFPFHEFFSLMMLKKMGDTEASYSYRNKNFQLLIRKKFLKNAQLVICFDTASWILINKCNELNIPFILDVSIAHSIFKNDVYAQIAEQYPLWNQFLEKKAQALLEIEKFEFANASHIVVASNFSKNSLINNGIDPQKISINAYGIDIEKFSLKQFFFNDKSINFIFSGLVDARKGIPLLLDVIEELPMREVNLSIVGPIQESVKKIIENNYSNCNIKIYGKIPHFEMPRVMQNHDVFIFPSYFEGFGLVILEAMASGLPVITTTATCGPDIITHGVEGFIIEPGDEKGLKIYMQYFIDNPSKIEEMGRAARKKAEQYTWDAYGDRWEKIIRETTKKYK